MGVLAPVVNTSPSEYNIAPRIIAFLSPIFSANAPKNGAPNPQARFCIAIAKLNSDLGQTNSS